MINRRVSLFYRYPLKTFHHMVRLCTLYGVCVVCPGTSELVGQHMSVTSSPGDPILASFCISTMPQLTGSLSYSVLLRIQPL